MTTTSRHRTNIATLFDVFCEIAGVSANGSTGEGSPKPLILQRYPEDFNDETILKSIRQFAFPVGFATDEGSDGAVQLFSFVLTDSNSQHTFGYCRYTPRTNTCICILSGYAWTNVFYKLLNHISIVMNNGTQSDVDTLLTRVYHTDTPAVGESLRLESIGHNLDVEIPDLSRLPTLKDDKFMLEFYNAVTPRQMISVYASLLKERRILFTGRKLGQLSSCVHAAATLFYPMSWQSLFIPVLPRGLKDMLGAPMPYLMGVSKQILDATSLTELGEVIVVDLDEKTLHGSFDDFAALPPEVQSALKSGLKAGIDMGDSLSRVFLRANLLLFGSYRVGLSRSGDSQVVTWDKDRFLAELRPSYSAFVASLLGTDGVQYLERFIEERLHALNTGTPINDEFEKEVGNYDSRSRSQNDDVIQQAVFTVRENANDVIGALKDRMQAIQIRDKLVGRLTPKETRKNREGRSRSAKRKESNGVQPLSFENIQWTSEQQYDFREDSPSASSDLVADLIDLGDTPTAPIPPSIPSATNSQSDFSDLLSQPSQMIPLTRTTPPLIPTVPLTVPSSFPPNPVFPLPPTNPFLVHASNHKQVYANPFFNAPSPQVAFPPTAPRPPMPPPVSRPRTSHNWERFE